MTPAPSDTVAPGWKPVPVIVAGWAVAPWPSAAGPDRTTGAGLIVKAPAAEPVPPSGLLTETPTAPVAVLLGTVTLAVSWVALTYVVELTVTPGPNDAAAPGWNPVPLIVTFWLVAPWPSAPGAAPLTVGSASTVKAPAPVAVLPSPPVTVTSRAPGVAVPATDTLAVNRVALTYVVELTVTPAPNEPASEAPLMKPVPVIVTFWPATPWARASRART